MERAAVSAIESGHHHQYTRPAGDASFTEYVSSMYSPLVGTDIDATKEVVAYSGAQQGILCALTAFCEEGDEIVVVEPCFDAYLKVAELQGVRVRGVPIRNPRDGTSVSHANDLKIDLHELERACNDNTKMIVLNTPQTFVGKVYSREELEGIASVVRRFDQLVVLSDEVYEFMCFEGNKHERIANLDGMYERTISLFSAGKTFSCTGWRCGYSIAPPQLSKPLEDAVANASFCAPNPLLRAVVTAFEHVNTSETTYFETLASDLKQKSDRLIKGLERTSLKPIRPSGGYFLTADCSALRDSDLFSSSYSDWAVCEWLTKEIGVVAIPASTAYTRQSFENADANFIRFAFCKTDKEIDRAVDRLIAGSEAHGALRLV